MGVKQYLEFISSRKSPNTVLIASGVLDKFLLFLNKIGIDFLEELSVRIIDDDLDSQSSVSAKTKRNHLGVIKRMLDQALKEDIINSNPAINATPPIGEPKDRHRLLTEQDLEIIFKGAGTWWLYYSFLYHTGLRAGDVSMLTYSNIDFVKKTITVKIKKSKRVHEFPLAQTLYDQLDMTTDSALPVFPELYAESDRKLNDNLAKPRKHMQSLLSEAGKEKATLHSFRHTFNTTLRDLGLGMEDRKSLLAHTSTATTRIYTHPNIELAAEYVNRMPLYPN